MTPAARKNGATVTTPATCAFPVGGKSPCGSTAAWQAPWKLLYGYETRTDSMPVCDLHAARFPEVAPL